MRNVGPFNDFFKVTVSEIRAFRSDTGMACVLLPRLHRTPATLVLLDTNAATPGSRSRDRAAHNTSPNGHDRPHSKPATEWSLRRKGYRANRSLRAV